jgi:hypothetical protein
VLRQEIDYQFYFILFYQLHFNPKKKEKKRKKGEKKSGVCL